MPVSISFALRAFRELHCNHRLYFMTGSDSRMRLSLSFLWSSSSRRRSFLTARGTTVGSRILFVYHTAAIMMPTTMARMPIDIPTLLLSVELSVCGFGPIVEAGIGEFGRTPRPKRDRKVWDRKALLGYYTSMVDGAVDIITLPLIPLPRGNQTLWARSSAGDETRLEQAKIPQTTTNRSRFDLTTTRDHVHRNIDKKEIVRARQIQQYDYCLWSILLSRRGAHFAALGFGFHCPARSDDVNCVQPRGHKDKSSDIHKILMKSALSLSIHQENRICSSTLDRDCLSILEGLVLVRSGNRKHASASAYTA